MTALDATFCAFGCGRDATGVREYRRNAREAVWLGACDACDAKAREDLAREEHRFTRQTTPPLADYVEADEVTVRRQQAVYRDRPDVRVQRRAYDRRRRLRKTG